MVITMAEDEKRVNLFVVYLWCLSFFKKYSWKVVTMLILGIVISICELSIPKFIQYFTDHILTEQNHKLFYTSLGLLVVVTILSFIANTINIFIKNIIAEQASRDLQASLFKHTRTLGFVYFENHSVGKTLSLMNTELKAVQNLYRDLFPWLMKESIFSSVALVFMFYMNVKLALIVFPCFLLYYLVGPYFDRQTSIHSRSLSHSNIALNQKTYETLTGLSEVRANGAEKWDMGRFENSINEKSKHQANVSWFGLWRGSIRRLSYYAGGVALFWYGFYLLKHQQLTVGEFVAFVLYFFATMHRLTSVITSIVQQKVLMFQAERLYQFMNIQPTVKEKATPITVSELKGNVSFRAVDFGYTEERPILSDLNLEIQVGKKTALVGSSGSGKSTILKLIGRFYDPSRGAIHIDNIPIKDISFGDLRNSMGFVFQETFLFAGTVRENILFGNPDASEEEIVASAKAAFAHDFISDLPNGYDTILGERGIRLSGGQKQRISIARMFLKNPNIIILDEPTSALDNISEYEVQKALTNLLRNRTTITVAHRLSTIKDYDRIVLLNNGKVVESGTFTELIKIKGEFYSLYYGHDETEVQYG
jgi:ATP-binding cassette subfamily B protein